MSVFERVNELIESGEPAAMLTIVNKDGSAPRDIGDRMLVTTDGDYGTIGGGTVEHLATEDARAVLAGKSDDGVRTYELEPGGNTGMVCGGSMDVFIERIRGRARLYIAGAGHISVELAPLAERLGYDVTVVDDREEYADPDAFPDDTDVVHGKYGEVLSELPMTEETSVAVATRSGTYDQRAVAAALDGNAGYVGLVASDTKTEHVVESLAEKGYSRRELARVRAPVGLDLGGSGPEDVALAILSEVNMDRYGVTGRRATRLNLDDLVVVRGGGDLGSGVVYRLHRAGYPVVVTEVERPTVVRREVAFATAMYEDDVSIDGVDGRRAADVDEAIGILEDDAVPVLEDPEASVASELDAAVVVDAILAKGRLDTGTRRDDADVVVGLGPGFEAGEDVDAVVETDRGHELGRVLYYGRARPYDGEPGERRGFTHERVLRAPNEGLWEPAVEIGDLVSAGESVGHVGGSAVNAEIDGLVRGLVHGGLEVGDGTKLGDIDPRGDDVDPTKISDKALCLGGGVLEAVLKLR
ncbi:selenium-dependent molybdenum hydroxylase system protein, YqeB family (plasmid) [Haloterrigena turkmenica DSM 5511]|uniref:Selenium-dependent molybdenum hydroxylase system protein, YqeB family n=1 Tax=Haloterrigena turkmenica (strain ATCC 51198 / DSM 5511 / JCM 9101 / NCIMB 13204 / VKM B-1734 / 4k) TaxID=543526 RepID=D2S094_HALTV|nr:selenium-dependent molybdenum cofactor biosynthesis protein YqeB [Haloterrigena turkmenica]ADB62791.1 selenium-dependent molybdenum hydroxylase system protein, YqeB family [Haloterrigena turkmenica DSM 5511]